ncbi:zinc-binding dehydrogenase [Blastococcus haudaquaticus]|uniref:zinc-binding dehydrogenase n=1 Tax=Blastococcus haudaquaticus TaxID=1938745 RepID=UPI00135B8234|nr:zinc-binding dehydrogenase [Blastococcus haudaquaticus]
MSDFPLPEIADGQVLVQMQYASICGSDVHIVHDGFHNPDSIGIPGYPGHEGVGVVVESRSELFAPGTPVLTVPHGHEGGCFAEYQAVAEQQVIPLPPDGDPLRLLMAQQLGTAVFAMKKFWQPDAETAAVVGVGSAGLFFVQLLLAKGCTQVVVSDVNETRLRAAQALGATGVLAPDASLAEEVLRATGGKGADLVIETSGLDIGRAEAVAAVRTHGYVGCFGYAERTGLSPFPVHMAFRKAATVAWVRDTQSEPGLQSFREGLRLIRSGEIDIDHHLGHVIPLEDTASGVETAHSGLDVVKVIISMPSSAG